MVKVKIINNSSREIPQELTVVSVQDSTLQGGSLSGHINYNKNDLNCKYVKKLKIIFINIMYGKKTINRY